MDMFGIKEALDRMAKASSVRWYGHVLKKEDENAIMKALRFKVSGSKLEEDRSKRGKSTKRMRWRKMDW